MTGAEQSIANRTYVFATENRPSSFAQFYNVLQSNPDWSAKTIATGHMVMHDNPEALINLLLAEAQR